MAFVAFGIILCATSGFSQDTVTFLTSSSNNIGSVGLITDDPVPDLTFSPFGNVISQGFDRTVIGHLLDNLDGTFDNLYTNSADVLAPGTQLSSIVQVGAASDGGNYNIYTAYVTAPDSNGVPEPASIALWSILGVIGLFAVRRRRRTA